MNNCLRMRRGRPCLPKRINFNPKIKYFKPRGVPVANLAVVELTTEELESLRLKYLKGYDQRDCASAMKTSPATVQRILYSAQVKTTDALINGKAIQIIEK